MKTYKNRKKILNSLFPAKPEYFQVKAPLSTHLHKHIYYLLKGRVLEKITFITQRQARVKMLISFRHWVTRGGEEGGGALMCMTFPGRLCSPLQLSSTHSTNTLVVLGFTQNSHKKNCNILLMCSYFAFYYFKNIHHTHMLYATHCTILMNTLFFLHLLTDQIPLFSYSCRVCRRMPAMKHIGKALDCIWATLLWMSKIPQGKELRTCITMSILICQVCSEECWSPWSLKIEHCD